MSASVRGEEEAGEGETEVEAGEPKVGEEAAGARNWDWKVGW